MQFTSGIRKEKQKHQTGMRGLILFTTEKSSGNHGPSPNSEIGTVAKGTSKKFKVTPLEGIMAPAK